MPAADPATTEGHLLGGRLRYVQTVAGLRTGIEPVFLAAAVPARRGQRVLEAGTGAGAALLCLAFRLPGVALFGIEADPLMAALARRNAAANPCAAEVTIIEADLVVAPDIGRFDHACANPPWHPIAGTAPPDPLRGLATRGEPGLLSRWAGALADRLRPRGTLTFILPAAALSAGVAALAAAGCGAVTLLPLWPRQGKAAKIILLQAVRGRGADRVVPGLLLHEPGGGYTAAAEAILRDGAELPLA